MTESTREDCQRTAKRTVDWLSARIGDDGSLGEGCDDLACYYKLPALMLLAGRPMAGHRLLDAVRARFLRPDGDFMTSDSVKTRDPVLSLYPGYINAWLTIAAQRLGRFDLSYPPWGYLRRFHHPRLDGFALAPAADADIEVLMCAHLGLAALYLGELALAESAGRALRRFLDQQPRPETRFYLRMTGAGALRTDFPAQAAGLHVVAADQPGQAWFFIGYPMAFLSRLYRANGDPACLETARGYFAFAERAAPHLVAEHFAHKVAWGAMELAAVTGEAAPRRLSDAIARHLIAAQDSSGTWMADQPAYTRFDQSAEVAIWLLTIAALA